MEFAAALAGCVVLYVVGYTLYAAVTTGPFVRTPRSVVRAGLKLADLRPGEMLVDLGCGHGQTLTIAAREFGAHAVGYELAPHHAFVAWCAGKLRGRGLTTVHWGDLYRAELANADVVFLWLTPRAFMKLEEKLARELRPGARVVTFSSPLPSWKPTRTEAAPGNHYHLFLYKVSR